MKQKHRNKYICLSGITGLFLILGSGFYFQFITPYHLFFKEQIQLFLLSSDYFFSYFSKPAALSCYIGDFATQFFYLRGGGPIVAAIMLWIEWLLVKQLLKNLGNIPLASLWALIPVLGEWILIPDINFRLAFSIGWIITLILFLGYTSIHKINPPIAKTLGVFFSLLFYPLFGIAVFLWVALIILFDIYKKQYSSVYWIVLLLIAVCVPALTRGHYLLTLQQTYLYPLTSYYLALFGFFLVITLIFLFVKPLRELKPNLLTVSFLSVCFSVFLIVGILRTVKPETETLLKMSTEAYFNNWKKVMDTADEAKNLHNTTITYYTNMALSKKGELPDKMLDYYQPFSLGLFLPVVQSSDWISILCSSDIYFYLGDLNMAQHSATLGMIFSPYQRSSRMVLRLAEINTVAGDVPAAMKYIRILGKTLFHKKQADKLETMLQAENENDYPSLKNYREKVHKENRLRGAHSHFQTLEGLVESNPANKEALDYLLCYSLLYSENKAYNVTTFFNYYNKYYKERYVYPPKIYSEALLIYFAAQEEGDVDTLTSYHINPKYVKEFNDYTSLYRSINGDLSQLQKKYGNTYWFYYHFATMQENK